MQETFLRDIACNSANAAILSNLQKLDLPNIWLVAGCLFQTVWNLQSGRHPMSSIKDYDIFYFDPTELSEASEQQAQARANEIFGELGITIEVSNQARVHLWYPTHFGRPYPPLVSSEDGIGRFLITETCVGVRPGQCHAPFGLSGIYSGTLSPNPMTPYPELFASKVASYQARWPHLSNHRS
jgi:hypothetical protein